MTFIDVLPQTPTDYQKARIIGNVFVKSYYSVLLENPEHVHLMYKDVSVLSRPDSSGVITTTTTMKGINEKIMNLKDFSWEIKNIDAQRTMEEGVLVLVTGYLIGTDCMKKKFVQSFLLASQEKGFYVLNDVFRIVDDKDTTKAVSVLGDNTNTFESVDPQPVGSFLHRPEDVDVPLSVDLLIDDPEVCDPLSEEDHTHEPEVCYPSDSEDESIPEKEVVDPPPANHLDGCENVTVTSVPAISQVDKPKLSYASILMATKTNTSPSPVGAPSSSVKAKRPNSNQEPTGFGKPAPVAEASASDSKAGPQQIDVPGEGKSYSIYVRNLPQSATSAQVEEIFAKFGSIKEGGVQVRSNKQGFCFGFVEFEALDSMKSAIEASPILIGTHKASIEEKRTTSRGPASPNNRRGWYSSSRGGSLRESFRGRGGFGGGRGFGRNDSRGEGGFTGRPRGSARRGSG